MIQTIIFVLSEVLIADLLGVEKPIAALAGIPETEVLPVFNTPALQDLFCGKVSEDVFLTGILQEQSWDISIDQLKGLIRTNFRRHVPDMEALLRHLRLGYQLVLLSDHASEWIAYIQYVHPFMQLFTARYYSFELRQTKREPSTFQKILAGLQQKPDECLFIDDSPVNIQAAQSVGLRSVQFTTAPVLISELTALGLMAKTGEMLGQGP